MKKYLEEIEKIDNRVFYSMEKYSQKIIDLVEDISEKLYRYNDEINLKKESVEALNYEIDILIEIWNPKFKDDLEVLYMLNNLIDNFSNNDEI